MTLCKCDCGQEIIKKPHHKYYGIPEYITGHFFRGKKRSLEHIEKMRQGNIGKKHTIEAIEKMRQAKLGKKRNPEAIENSRQGHLGKKHTPETIEKMRQVKLGKKQSPEAIEKNRQAHLLEKNSSWRGGISFIPYCIKFNKLLKEKIRERDNRICQNCGKTEIEEGKKLSVHHIHYDKENCYPDLITLCCSCNSRVNSNRDYWEEHFMKILEYRDLINYFGEDYVET